MFNITEIDCRKGLLRYVVIFSDFMLRVSFGIKKPFNTFCEQFWLTVLAIALIPATLSITWPIYIIYWIFKQIFEIYNVLLLLRYKKFLEEIDIAAARELSLTAIANDSRDEIRPVLKIHSYRFYKKLIYKLHMWGAKDKFRDRDDMIYQAMLDTIRLMENLLRNSLSSGKLEKQYEKFVKEEQAKNQVRLQKRVTLKRYGMWLGKWVGGPLIGLMIIVASVLFIKMIYLFVNYLWSNYWMDWHFIKSSGKWIISAITGTIIALFFAFKNDYCREYIANAFSTFLKKGLNGIDNIWNGILIFKSNSCPTIIRK